jgi:hypothetical protein
MALAVCLIRWMGDGDRLAVVRLPFPGCGERRSDSQDGDDDGYEYLHGVPYELLRLYISRSGCNFRRVEPWARYHGGNSRNRA